MWEEGAVKEKEQQVQQGNLEEAERQQGQAMDFELYHVVTEE